jgi:hypothetical protein
MNLPVTPIVAKRSVQVSVSRLGGIAHRLVNAAVTGQKGPTTNLACKPDSQLLLLGGRRMAYTLEVDEFPAAFTAPFKRES